MGLPLTPPPADPTFRDALVLGEEARQAQRYREAEGYLRQALALDPAAAREAEVMLQLARAAHDGAGQGQYSVEDASTILTEALQSRRRGVLIDHAFHVERDPEQALGLKRESLLASWESDPEKLNEFAWWCFEHQVNFAEAEALTRKAVELTPHGPDLANNLDTLAQLVHARGDTHEALALITRAISQNPGNEYLKEQEAKFRGLLAERGGQ